MISLSKVEKKWNKKTFSVNLFCRPINAEVIFCYYRQFYY